VATLLGLCRAIDAVNAKLAIVANWLVLLACLVSAGNALVRYGFNLSSNAWLEIQWYMFAGMVMLGASYTLQVNEHVRVDILYGGQSTRRQIHIDLIGSALFLLPMCALIGWFAWDMFQRSYALNEGSFNAGGLLRWPVKLLIPLGFALLFLQGVSEIVKRLAALKGRYTLTHVYHKPLQ
jgi:TRAP-type mannitol/chloroaromatic compound transport system permease small subunit